MLSIIIPTYREKQNIPLIVKKLQEILDGIDYKIIFVDANEKNKSYEGLIPIILESPCGDII